MSIIEVTYYQAVCDRCYVNVNEDPWATSALALDELHNLGGSRVARPGPRNTGAIETLIACPACYSAWVAAGGPASGTLVEWIDAGVPA